MKKLIVLILLYFISFSSLYTVSKEGIHWWHHSHFLYFACSFFTAFIVLYRKMPVTSFYSTLRHELCHWFFSVLTFSKPHSIQVNYDGSGHYQHIGKGNILLSLAPYFFPIVSFTFLLISIFFQKPSSFYFVVLGVALAFDLVSMFKDYHFHQSDWKKNGILFSIQFSVLMLVNMLLFFFIILFNGFDEGWNLLKKIFLQLFTFFN